MTDKLQQALVKLRHDLTFCQRERAMESLSAALELLPAGGLLPPDSEELLHKIIGSALAEAERLINEGSFENAYDLVDAVHCLPEIAECPDRDMKAYWRSHIKRYHKKWGAFFMGFKKEILKM